MSQFDLPLEPGDRVVAAVNYRDTVLIFTERGIVFEYAIGNHGFGVVKVVQR